MKKNPGILPILLTSFLIVYGTFIRAQVTSLTNTENTVKELFKKKSKPAKVDSTQNGGGGTAAAGGSASGGAMGVDGARLTTKGLGDNKPISDNATQEGKANNRRVEFVRQ